jgi:arsenite-transporting ATPase
VNAFPEPAARFLFFTGKGGVGKTSMACATAVALAGAGKRVLLISTDPASNLDEVLETPLGQSPREVTGVAGLDAMNIDPEEAARSYRERIVAPYRGILPDAAVTSIEEQLSGACTVEIASFNEFTRLIGHEETVAAYDNVILDTAPTGHTLRLLSLPAAWNDFIANNKTGSSCLGPLAGLKDQRVMYERAVATLGNPALTMLVLVTRAETTALKEAARAGEELAGLGIRNQHLIVNGAFTATDSSDPVAAAFGQGGRATLELIPETLAALPRTNIPFRAEGFTGVRALRGVFDGHTEPVPDQNDSASAVLPFIEDFNALVDRLAEKGSGVIMTMGKGGVGKTTLAAAIAVELSRRGLAVHLSTTDPAAHVTEAVGESMPNLRVSRIDPAAETRGHIERVMAATGSKLDEDGRMLLAEELRSPCTEEIAVFQAFARIVAEGKDRIVVLDTAPTGHTLLLLDATEAYHREVLRSASELPETVRELLPRLRDADYTKVLLVTLPEATPVHEAAQLQSDLRRAGIEPFAWVINQSFAAAGTSDPLLKIRAGREVCYIGEVTRDLAEYAVIVPWMGGEHSGQAGLRRFVRPQRQATETAKST